MEENCPYVRTKHVQTLKLYQSGPDSLPQSKGTENIALDTGARLGKV